MVRDPPGVGVYAPGALAAGAGRRPRSRPVAARGPDLVAGGVAAPDAAGHRPATNGDYRQLFACRAVAPDGRACSAPARLPPRQGPTADRRTSQSGPPVGVAVPVGDDLG